MEALNYRAGVTADTLVNRGYTKYWGFVVTTATAGGVIEIRDGLTTSGTLVQSIPASTAVGVNMLNAPLALTSGLFVDFTGTGTLTLLFEGSTP
jgi:hypothetical protein